MHKKTLVLLLAALLPACGALAEVYTGQTVAAATLRVEAEDGEALLEAQVRPGAQVCAGDVLASLATTRVFAGQDGTAVRLRAAEGDRVDGAVLEIAPVSPYTVYCTVDGAYSSPETMLVHAGETLYARCTADGTHRAVGTVTRIDGDTYELCVTGGTLYIGETVYLYRDADFSSSQRTGIGTVVASETETYEAQGALLRLCVEEGAYVERGELLYEYAAEGRDALASPVDGVVLEADEGGFTLAPLSEICVEVQVDEAIAARLQPGDAVTLVYAADPAEQSVSGTILDISRTVEDGLCTVRIAPEAAPERIGLTVEVRLPDE